MCLVGASGCGKSTLLNLVAGLDQPTAGTVQVDGRTGLMFQESALFPWLTVAGNVELALRLRPTTHCAGEPRRQRADALLKSVHLDGSPTGARTSCPAAWRQRVALARAFAQDADVC